MPQQLDLSKFQTTPKLDTSKFDSGQPEPDIDTSIPDYGTDEENAPEAPAPDEGWFHKAYRMASQPLVDAPSRFARSVSEYINPERTTQGVRGIGSAYLEALGEGVSGLTSPINLALMGGGLATKTAAELGAPTAAKMLNYATRGASAPIAGHGAYQAATGKTWDERVLGAVEAVMGGMGMRSHLPTPATAAAEHPILRGPEFEDPAGMDWVNQELAKLKEGKYTQEERPAGPWDANAPAGEIPKKTGDQLLFDLAREKHGMAVDMPESEISRSGPIDESKYSIPDVTQPITEGNIFKKMQAEGMFGGDRTTGDFEPPPGSLADTIPNFRERMNVPEYGNDMVDELDTLQHIGKPESRAEGSRFPAAEADFDPSTLKFGDQLKASLAERAKPPAEETPTLYHGTKEVFDTFDESQNQQHGLYSNRNKFTENPEYSQLYSLDETPSGLKRESQRPNQGESPNTIAAKINPDSVLDLTKPIPPEQLSVLEEKFPQYKGVTEPGQWHDILKHSREEVPFDAIKYSEHGEDNWAVHPDVETRTPAGVPLSKSAVKLDMEKFGAEEPISEVADQSSITNEPLTQENFDAKMKRLGELMDLDSQNNPSKLTEADLAEGKILDKQLRDAGFDKNNVRHKTNQDLADYNKNIADAIAKKEAKDKLRKTASELKTDQIADVDKKFLRLNELKEKAQSGKLSIAETREAKALSSELRDKTVSELKSRMGGNQPPNGPRKPGSPAGGGPPPKKPLLTEDQLDPNIPVQNRKSSPKAPSSKLAEIWNLPRSMQSIDLPGITSAALRQSRPLAFTRDWFKGWVEAAKSFGSADALKAIQEDIRSSKYFEPRYEPIINKNGDIVKYSERPSIAEEMGVKMTDFVNDREEAIISSLAEKIPLYGRYVKASNRAYTGFLNSLRKAKFEQLMDAAKAGGEGNNVALGKDIADFVNNATGRGSLKYLGGKINLETSGAAKVLGNSMYSPRALSARLAFMNPTNYMKAAPMVRNEYWKGLARIGVSWGAASGLASMMPDTYVSMDPNNADFGKIRIGNTRFDPGAGFQQLLVLANRELPRKLGGGGITSSSGKPGVPGHFTPFGQGFKPETRLSTAGKYAYNQLHPSLRFIFDMLSSTKKEPFDLTDRTLQMALPMYATDIADAAKDDNYVAAFFAPLLSSMGAGVQSYGKNDFNKPKITPFVKSMTGVELPTAQIGR